MSAEKGEAVNTMIGNEAIQNLWDGANVEKDCKEGVKVGRLRKTLSRVSGVVSM